jgi:hypothetical protein
MVERGVVPVLVLVSGAQLAQQAWPRALEWVSGARLAEPAWLLALASAQGRARARLLVVGDWAAPQMPAAEWPRRVARELLRR